MDNPSAQQQEFISWIRSAPADQVTSLGHVLAERINTLPENERKRFYSQLDQNYNKTMKTNAQVDETV